MRHKKLVGAVAVMAAALALTGAPAASATPSDLRVIASGFAGPLHIAFGPGHSLYVADAFAGSVVKVNLRTHTSRTIADGLGFSPGVDVGREGQAVRHLDPRSTRHSAGPRGTSGARAP